MMFSGLWRATFTLPLDRFEGWSLRKLGEGLPSPRDPRELGFAEVGGKERRKVVEYYRVEKIKDAEKEALRLE